MSANRTALKCPSCSYDGGDQDPHTHMTSSRQGIGFRCAGCGALFSVASRQPGSTRRRVNRRPEVLTVSRVVVKYFEENRGKINEYDLGVAIEKLKASLGDKNAH